MRVLYILLLFGLSFLVTSQIMAVVRGEGSLLTWALILVGVAGFVWALRLRGRISS